jgi:hypothetical protein
MPHSGNFFCRLEKNHLGGAADGGKRSSNALGNLITRTIAINNL